jgi:putative DNA primase/helicase
LENFYEILGPDYGASFSPDAMMAQGNDNFSLSTLAQMRGVRYATTSESGENDALKVSLVKMITGGDTITVKFMRQDSFNYRPKFKVWIRTNHKPRVNETTDPIWRRIVLIPFLHQIPEEKIRTRQEVDYDIMAEAPGVLAWAVRGARQYLENGLQMPDIVNEAVDRYRTENDPIGMFIREQCTLNKELTTTRTGFRSALEQWGRGIVGWRKAPSTQKIAAYLEAKHGIYVDVVGGDNVHSYVGLALNTELSSGTMEDMLA